MYVVKEDGMSIGPRGQGPWSQLRASEDKIRSISYLGVKSHHLYKDGIVIV